jgi:hypothetical protein
VLGQGLDASKSCHLAIGSYCQIHEETLPRNSASVPCTVDAIALCAVNNLQGSYLFLRLDTWRCVDRCSWTELPMPQHVIKAIEAKALSEASPKQQKKMFTFRRRNRSVITSLQSIDSHLLADLRPPDEGAVSNNDDSDLSSDNNQHDDTSHSSQNIDSPSISSSSSSYDSTSVSPDSSHTSGSENISFDPTTTTNDEPSVTPNSISVDNDDDISYDSQSIPDNTNIDSRSASDTNSMLDTVINDISSANEIDATVNDAMESESDETSSDDEENKFLRFAVNPEISESNVIEMEPDKSRPGTSTYNLRKRNPPHGHNFHTFNVEPANPTVSPYNFNGRYGFVMTQMTAREGLRRFGERAAEALVQEWIQLNKKMYFKAYLSRMSPPSKNQKL